jgi:predicted O-methyltransferase YrrM
VIPTATRFLRGGANAAEALGARRRVRRAPSDIAGAYDFVAAFKYGLVELAPFQIRAELLAFLERLAETPPRTVVELGTANGGTLFMLARVAAPDATLVSVDLPGSLFGDGYPRTRAPLLKSFARPGQSIELIRADSHAPETLARVRSIVGDDLDVLFIDADHRYEGVRHDYELYAPLVRRGGLIAFHDIAEGPADRVGGVPRFWEEIRGDEFEEIIADRTQGGFGIGLIRSDGRHGSHYVRASKTTT